MHKVGIFTDSHGNDHAFYELTDTGFFRLDLCVPSAEFQVDTDGVEYSLYRRRKTLEYGNTTLYKDYQDFDLQVQNARGSEETKSEWSEGNYYQTSIISNKAAGFLQETVTCNGSLSSYMARIHGQLLTYSVLNPMYESKIVPLNIADYTELRLDNDIDEITLDTPYYPLSMLRQKYPIAHIDKEDYCVVSADDMEEAYARLYAFRDADTPYKGFDTETTGTDVCQAGVDNMVGIILAQDEHTSTYFPFAMDTIPNLGKDFLDELMSICIAQQEKLVAQNKKFDRQVMLKLGYDIRIKWDTLLISFLLNPVIERGAHALKELILLLNGKKYLELTEIFISPKLINFAKLPADIVKVYACADSSNVIVLLKDLLSKVPPEMMPLVAWECHLGDVKADQEFYGERVDTDLFLKNYENCNYMVEKLIKLFRELTHEDGNINSQQVMVPLIYDRMRCPVLVRTATNKRSTSSAAIVALASMKAAVPNPVTQDVTDMFGHVIIKASELAESKYPELVILDHYHKYNKSKTAFYARFERTMRTGRIYFWINQNGATSGRQSSPMHQLPPELKDVILSDSPDHDLWGPDYSQVEIRMESFLAGQKDLSELCSDSENDIHRVIGSMITGRPMHLITPAERTVGKRRNFGVIYEISGYGLAKQLYGPKPSKAQVAFCDEQLDAFFDRFKYIDRYIRGNADKVMKDGYMETYFHRKKYFKEIFDPDISPRKRASLLRQANNMPVQGTAADMMKIAECNVDSYIRQKGWDELMPNGFPRVRGMLSIHDEMHISADRSIPYEEIIAMIRICMEIDIEGAPPFFVSPAKMENWGGHSDDTLAIPIKLRDKLIEDYVNTGVSRINYDNYKQVLDDYRDTILKDYMTDVISKYGPDPANVASHVEHPALTHDLIGRYKDTIQAEGITDHVEKIFCATRAYMAGVEGTISIVTPPEEHANNDIDDRALFSELGSLVNFDGEGRVVWDEEEPDEDYAYNEYDDVDYINMRATGEVYRCWKMGDIIVGDVQNLTVKECDEVVKYFWNIRTDGGFYSLHLLYANKMLDTGIRLEHFDDKAASEFIAAIERRSDSAAS